MKMYWSTKIMDIVHCTKIKKEVQDAINKTQTRERLFLTACIGLVEYENGTRRILTPSEYMNSEHYRIYRQYVDKYDDEFLLKYWIH